MKNAPILIAALALAACDSSREEPANVNDAVSAQAPSANAAIPKEANSVEERNAASTNAATPASQAAEPAVAPESYSALGQEPGWSLRIADGRIDYIGNYGEKKISVARPEPRPSFNGRRYVTPRLTVDVTYTRCNDAMSGFGFEHQVTVIADGETYKGCGGARKKAWDM